MGWPLPFISSEILRYVFTPAHAEGLLETDFVKLAQTAGWIHSLPAQIPPFAGLHSHVISFC